MKRMRETGEREEKEKLVYASETKRKHAYIVATRPVDTDRQRIE